MVIKLDFNPQLFATSEWYEYFFLYKKKNTIQTRLLFECFKNFELKYPFLDETQHWGRVYQFLGIPHICGKVNRGKLKEIYKNEKKQLPRKNRLDISIRKFKGNKSEDKNPSTVKIQNFKTHENLEEVLTYLQKIDQFNNGTNKLIDNPVKKSICQVGLPIKKKVRFKHVQILSFEKTVSNYSDSELSSSPILYFPNKKLENYKNEKVIHKPYFARFNDSISNDESITDSDGNDNDTGVISPLSLSGEEVAECLSGKNDSELVGQIACIHGTSPNSAHNWKNSSDTCSSVEEREILIDNAENISSDLLSQYPNSENEFSYASSTLEVETNEGYHKHINRKLILSSSLKPGKLPPNDHLRLEWVAEPEFVENNLATEEKFLGKLKDGITILSRRINNKIERNLENNEENLADCRSNVMGEKINEPILNLSKRIENNSTKEKARNEGILNTAFDVMKLSDSIQFRAECENIDMVEKHSGGSVGDTSIGEDSINLLNNANDLNLDTSHSREMVTEEYQISEFLGLLPPLSQLRSSSASEEDADHLIRFLPSGNLVHRTLDNLENYRFSSFSTSDENENISQDDVNSFLNREKFDTINDTDEQSDGGKNADRITILLEQNKSEDEVTRFTPNQKNSPNGLSLNDDNLEKQLKVIDQQNINETSPLSNTQKSDSGSSGNIVQTSFNCNVTSKREPLKLILNTSNVRNSRSHNFINTENTKNFLNKNHIPKEQSTNKENTLSIGNLFYPDHNSENLNTNQFINTFREEKNQSHSAPNVLYSSNDRRLHKGSGTEILLHDNSQHMIKNKTLTGSVNLIEVNNNLTSQNSDEDDSKSTDSNSTVLPASSEDETTEQSHKVLASNNSSNLAANPKVPLSLMSTSKNHVKRMDCLNNQGCEGRMSNKIFDIKENNFSNNQNKFEMLSSDPTFSKCSNTNTSNISICPNAPPKFIFHPSLEQEASEQISPFRGTKVATLLVQKPFIYSSGQQTFHRNELDNLEKKSNNRSKSFLTKTNIIHKKTENRNCVYTHAMKINRNVDEINRVAKNNLREKSDELDKENYKTSITFATEEENAVKQILIDRKTIAIQTTNKRTYDADSSSGSITVTANRKIKRRKRRSAVPLKLKNKNINVKFLEESSDEELIKKIQDEIKRGTDSLITNKKTTTTNSILIKRQNEEDLMVGNTCNDHNSIAENMESAPGLPNRLRKTSIVRQFINHNGSDTSTVSEFITSALARRIYYLNK